MWWSWRESNFCRRLPLVAFLRYIRGAIQGNAGQKSVTRYATCLKKKKPVAVPGQNGQNGQKLNRMAKVTFHLHTPNMPASYIRLQFFYGGNRLVYYPGEKVKPRDWSQTAQRVKRNAPGADQINEGLERVAALVLEIWRSYRNKGKPLPTDLFRSELDARWKGINSSVSKDISLLGFWSQICDERAVSPNYAANTVRAYRSALNKIQEFARATRRRVDFDTVNLDLHGALVAWMARKGHSPNFIHKILSFLKVIMSEAQERGLHENNAFRSRKFTAKRYEPEHVFLTEQEIEAIAALSVPPRLARARDLFLIGCYTGLRFSDYSKLKPENIVRFDGVEMLALQTTKTRTDVAIPIFEPARLVLDRNGGIPPAGISNQKLNKYLKELCRLAGIVEPVRITAIRGGERIETVSEKCDLVSTHTARRSWATNEYLRATKEGRSYRPIMQILGMSKESTFFRYVKVQQRETAALYAQQRGR